MAENDSLVRKAEGIAKDVLSEHFGSAKPLLCYQESGLTNCVFLAESGDKKLVAKLSPNEETYGSFCKEKWCAERAQQAGIPTPEVLQVGENQDWAYMILRQAEGFEATELSDVTTLIREMGKCARVINEIETHGFGEVFDWAPEEDARRDSWRDFVERELQLDKRLDALRSLHMLTVTQADEVREAIIEFGNAEPRLNHGDLRLKNVLANDEGELTAIIDWGHSISSIAPHWELSIALHDLSIDHKQAFVQGYGISERELAQIAWPMRALNIVNYVPFIERALAENDEEALEGYRMRLSGLLDLY